jgi:Flp pilus assembly pilin Flp
MNRSPEVNLNRSRGQGLVEYGLIVALVGVVAVASLIFLGSAFASVLIDLSASV